MEDALEGDLVLGLAEVVLGPDEPELPEEGAVAVLVVPEVLPVGLLLLADIDDRHEAEVPARLRDAIQDEDVPVDEEAGPEGGALVQQATKPLLLVGGMDRLEAGHEVAGKVAVKREGAAREGRAVLPDGVQHDGPRLVGEVLGGARAPKRRLQEVPELGAQEGGELAGGRLAQEQLAPEAELGELVAEVHVWDDATVHAS